MNGLVILGAGGHGREVLDVIEAVNRVAQTYRVLGFLDDGPAHPELLAARGASCLGKIADLAGIDADYVIGIGSGHVREHLDDLATRMGREAAVLVHPSATVGSEIALGMGTIVTAGVRVTTNVTLGRHVHLNVNASVGHDCVLDDYVTISPGANLSGNVTVGERTTIGAGATVIPGVRVGAGATIGAGAAVITDVPAGATAAGVPARLLGTPPDDRR
jgi:sugar O-acyltransferase (sialic acid O-acetyltransferase NeuD family)